MKVDIKKIVVLVLWVSLLILLYKKGLITLNADEMKGILGKEPVKMMMIFILISAGRVLFFVPGLVFMVLGGICFGPVMGFFLSMLSMVISETIIFIIGKYFAGARVNTYLNKNYRDLMILTDKHGYEFLALGILCPIAPTDMICLVTTVFNFNYKKYIVTVILSNTPMMLIYSYLGNSGFKSLWQTIILVIVMGIVLIYTLMMWVKIKSKSQSKCA